MSERRTDKYACRDCDGTGLCWRCGGEGIWDGGDTTCGFCGGDGGCDRCGGTGTEPVDAPDDDEGETQ